MVFTSYRSRNKEIDTRIPKANAVPRELCCSGVKTGAFKVRKAFSFQIGLCFDPHPWTWTSSNHWKNAFPRTSGKNGFPRIIQGVTLCDKVHRSEIRKAQNVKPLLWIERSQLRWFGHVSRISQKRLTRQVLLATPAGKPSRGLPRTRWRDYICDLAWSPSWCGPRQGRSQDFSKGGAEVMEAKALKRKSCLWLE